MKQQGFAVDPAALGLYVLGGFLKTVGFRSDWTGDESALLEKRNLEFG